MSYLRQCPKCKTLTQDVGKNRAVLVPSIVTLHTVPQVLCFSCRPKDEPAPRVETTPKYQQEVKQATDSGVKQSLDNGDVEFKRWTYQCIVTVAKRQKEFTINDVRDLIHSGNIKTHDNRVIGGVMRVAASRKVMRSTGRSLANKVGHGTQIQIWESLLYVAEK